jgi:hypothetical protein
MEIFENTTRQRIFLLLIDNPNQTAKQIYLKLGFKYKTIFKELQNLVRSKILIKDDCKRYWINPEYGDLLIEYGLKIKGLVKKPDIVVFMNEFNGILERMKIMENYLSRNVFDI